LINIEVRQADVTNLAFFLELGEGRPTLLDVLIWLSPVNLVQVDGINFKPSQTRFTLAPEGFGLQAAAELTALIPNPRTLGEDIRPVRDTL
jgi:hypothetical protein